MFCTKCGGQLDGISSFCAKCGTPVGGTAPQVESFDRVEKKLTRPMGSQWLAGVCAGFAKYFGIDVTLVRLLWLFTVILAGTGILAYIICWIVMPREYST
jgi:phage shock protein C